MLMLILDSLENIVMQTSLACHLQFRIMCEFQLRQQIPATSESVCTKANFNVVCSLKYVCTLCALVVTNTPFVHLMCNTSAQFPIFLNL